MNASAGKLWDQWKTASSSILQLACDKGVCSAHVCFVQYLSAMLDI